MSAQYIELHAHSAFSFLDGASTPLELAAAAAENGYPAFALTDHDGIWGSMEFAHACQGFGVRAITGVEVTVSCARGNSGDLPHLTLLVEDAVGYRNLCRLLTAAHSHTRDNTGRTAGQPCVTLEQVEEHAEGLVCLSGCAGEGAVAGTWARGDPAGAAALARRLLACFGRERFRVELQRPYWRHDRARNRWLADLAERLGVPCVATGNVHSHAAAALACRMPSSPCGWGRRWRRASRGAAATRPRPSHRRKRWRSASPSIPGRSPRPCASPSGSAST